MPHGFASNANARMIDPSRLRPRHSGRPLVLIVAPKELTPQESLCVSDVLKERHAEVDVLRISQDFRVVDIVATLRECTWLLLALGEHPGHELEVLREAQRVKRPPKIGVICLAHRIHLPDKRRMGSVDFIVRRSPADNSLSSSAQTNHFMLVEDLLDEASVRSIARVVIPRTL